jgi:hypothetical protein
LEEVGCLKKWYGEKNKEEKIEEKGVERKKSGLDKKG